MNNTLSDKQLRTLQQMADGWTLAQSLKTGDGYLYRIENDRRQYNRELTTVSETTIKALNSRALIERVGVALERQEWKLTAEGIQLLTGVQ